VYAREIEDRELTFGVSGKLIMNALVMYDRQTDSLWSQFLGVAVDGEFAGTPLEPLPATLTDWATWRSLHPDTVVLDQGGERFDPYTGYYLDGSAGVFGERVSDDRLGTKEFVLGLQLEDGLQAYAYRHLSDHPVVNDRVGSLDVAVFFAGRQATAAAWEREVEGQLLTFVAAPDVVAPDGGPAVLDAQTGSTWSALSGNAFEGPLAGAQLTQVTATPMFWFAWTDFFPSAPLWDPPQD
jgi:hypothetical protein